MNVNEAWRSIEALFSEQRLGVLSTCADGVPYSTLIGFAVAGDLKTVIFATLRNTRKYAHISANERVSLLIDSSKNEVEDFRDARALTVIGRARETGESERAKLWATYIRRHGHLADFLKDPACALMELQVEKYILVSNFQNVLELTPRP
jgi:nitroimidazol reductase NimA-like FMN-containing flavoprotein (pyridoxamine 5'-phosphate oxidase superfamily)